MNLFQLQERLKDFSQDQLVNEMRNPSGSAPQYLVLSELQRRRRLMQEEQAQMPQQQATVAEEAVAAAGMPQGGLAQMAQALAPQTDTGMNTARMAEGGKIRRDVYERNRPREMEEDPFRYMMYDGPTSDDFRGFRRDHMAPPEPERDPFLFLAYDPFDRSMRNARAAMRTRADERYEADLRDALSAIGSDYEGMGARERSLREEDDDMRDMIESLMRSQSETVGGFAEGGVVRMQPGGLADISRDLRTYMNPNDRTRALLSHPYVVQRGREMSATPEEEAAAILQYASSLSPYDADYLIAADLQNQADLAAMQTPVVSTSTEPVPVLEPEALAQSQSAISLFPQPDFPTPEEEAANQAALETAQRELDARLATRNAEAAARNAEAAEVLGRDDAAELRARADELAAEAAALSTPPLPEDFGFGNIPAGSLPAAREEEEADTDAAQQLTFAPSPLPPSMRDEGTPLSFSEELTATEEDLLPIRSELSFGDLEAQRDGTPAPATTGGAAGLSSSDDLFEQDKWLALAQFGLGLMNSQAPTLGQAIGEAGATGIAALRQAREDQQARATAAQTRADRLAAAAARAADDSEAYPYRQVDDFIELAKLFQQRAAAIVEANNGFAPQQGEPGYAEYIDALARSNAAISESARLADLQ